MKITKEFQPYINKTLNQPRTCLWIEAEDITEFQLLQKLNNSIKWNDTTAVNKEVISGFTGIEKQILLIQFPQ